MQSLETKSSRPRPKLFETKTRPETFETETWKNGVSRLHHCHCVVRSVHNPEILSKYLIQSGWYPEKTLIKHLTAVINAIWISKSEPVEFFRNPVRSGSELQNPVGSRSGIMFKTASGKAVTPLLNTIQNK